ncbi:hypothetical protein B2I22_20905, partial [Bacillus spizizenii]|uniref:hypothetical protein n=1 Tax=Bacillus spizizenii TaxID=96241 RepID=UPI0009CA913B
KRNQLSYTAQLEGLALVVKIAQLEDNHVQFFLRCRPIEDDLCKKAFLQRSSSMGRHLRKNWT